MNVYQFVRSNPTNFLDPNGTKRIIALINGQDFWDTRNSGNNNTYGTANTFLTDLSKDNKNIVKAFEEDSDWSEPRGDPEAADWIIKEREKAQGCNSPIILIGHSNGADATLKIAEQLRQKAYYKVELMVTFDPIGKPIHPGPGGRKDVPSNVKEAWNFYQRIAKLQIGFFKLQGYLLNGAQKQEQWSISLADWTVNYSKKWGGTAWGPHISIMDEGSGAGGKFSTQVINKINSIPEILK